MKKSSRGQPSSRDKYGLALLEKQEEMRKLLDEYEELREFAQFELRGVYLAVLANEAFFSLAEMDMIARYAKEIGIEKDKWKRFICKSGGSNTWGMTWRKWKMGFKLQDGKMKKEDNGLDK